MTGRLLHLSDLHTGANDGGREEIDDAVRLLAAELDPELVVCTGDLSHRNRRDQHERAAAFLRSLDRPLLVVPGNHDLPHSHRRAGRPRSPRSTVSGPRWTRPTSRSHSPRSG